MQCLSLLLLPEPVPICEDLGPPQSPQTHQGHHQTPQNQRRGQLAFPELTLPGGTGPLCLQPLSWEKPGSATGKSRQPERGGRGSKPRPRGSQEEPRPVASRQVLCLTRMWVSIICHLHCTSEETRSRGQPLRASRRSSQRLGIPTGLAAFSHLGQDAPGPPCSVSEAYCAEGLTEPPLARLVKCSFHLFPLKENENPSFQTL